jgi:PAS domain S-box-containing protein
VLLTAGSIALALLVRLLSATGATIDDVMYLPIAVACLWWGLRGLAIAAVLAATLLGLHAFGIGATSLWGDAIRAGLFLLAGLAIGLVRDRMAAGERALALSESTNRALLENSPQGMLVHRDGKVLFANAKLCGLLGTGPGSIVGAGLDSFVRAEDLGGFRALAADPELPMELPLTRGDGTKVWAEASASRVEYQGREAVRVTVTDVSARRTSEEKQRELVELARRQEEQLEHSTRLAELGEMAAAISHELNQPLTGIRNYARNAYYMLDQKAGGEEEVKANLRLISEQVDRAAKIINQMRELTRRSDNVFTLLDLNSVVRESVEFLLPQMRLSEVEVSLGLAPDLPPIRGDRIRLAQVFLNLLSNARQAMDGAATRLLSITSRSEGGAAPAAVVEVRDTGKGFTEEQARRLFQPFYTTRKGGHGLGLSISRTIIQDHAGVIEATGTPGAGAVFSVRLPAARSGT